MRLYCRVVHCTGAYRRCLDYFSSKQRSMRQRRKLLRKLNSVRTWFLDWHTVWASAVFTDKLPDGTHKQKIVFGQDATRGNMPEVYALYHNHLSTLNRSLSALGDRRGLQLETEARGNSVWMLNGAADALQDMTVPLESLTLSPDRAYNVDTTTSQAAMVKAGQMLALACARSSPEWTSALTKLHQDDGYSTIAKTGNAKLEMLYSSWLRNFGFGILRSD